MPDEPHHGAPPADPPEISLVIRLEPYGPTTAIFVPHTMTMGKVKELALSRVGPAVHPSTAVIARRGWVLDESKTVADLELHAAEYLSVGSKADVDLASNTGKPRG